MNVTTRLAEQGRALRCGAVQQLRLSPFRRLSAWGAGHTGHCLACQAEMVRERTLTRMLADLRQVVEQAPADLPARVAARMVSSAAPSRPVRSVPSRGSVVVASVVAVGVALAASRRLRPAPG